jgi:hypothetical protein
VRVVNRGMSGRHRPHSGEIVPYPQWEEWLFRCWGCAARVWCGSLEEAEQVERAHRRAPDDTIVPRRVHGVALVNDKGTDRRLMEFDSQQQAMAFIDRNIGTPRWWGWSFAYFTGARSPKVIMRHLSGALPGQAEELALPSGE